MVNGVSIAVNPTHVIWVEPDGEGSQLLVTTNTMLCVQESFGEVMLLLAEDKPPQSLLANNISSQFAFIKGKP